VIKEQEVQEKTAFDMVLEEEKDDLRPELHVRIAFRQPSTEWVDPPP
jgi:hypothetical protein